jgi:hypothetical protein
MFVTPAYLAAQLIATTEDAYMGQADRQVATFNDMVANGQARNIPYGMVMSAQGWYESHYVKDSLALIGVTRRTDRVIEAAREAALGNIALLEERVSQHLATTDTITGNDLYIVAGRIEGRVYGITKDSETFNVYVRMMWNYRYGENSANGVMTQYAQFRSERQGARQEGKPVVTERQAAAEAAKAEREAAKEARRAALLEEFKKVPTRLAKSSLKNIEVWGETHPTAPEWRWVAQTAEKLTEEEIEQLFVKGFRTSGDLERHLEREFNRQALVAV